MDETGTNREAMRRAFEAWRDGTGAIVDAFAPDMVWRIEGHSAASREYASKAEFTAFYDSISFNDLWSRIQP